MVPGRVLETMSAELDGRAHDSLPEEKKRWRYSEFDSGVAVPLTQIIRRHAFKGLDGFLRDPESAHIVRSERFVREAVRVERARLHLRKPI